MPSAMTHGDEEHATGFADLGSVPNALGNHHRTAAREWHLLKPGRLLQQHHCGARQQIDELLGLGMHLPIRPVRGELELGDEPAMAKAIELRLRLRPEALTARKPLGGTTSSEVDVGFTWIEVQGTSD
jgi:hypothetical protein